MFERGGDIWRLSLKNAQASWKSSDRLCWTSDSLLFSIICHLIFKALDTFSSTLLFIRIKNFRGGWACMSSCRVYLSFFQPVVPIVAWRLLIISTENWNIQRTTTCIPSGDQIFLLFTQREWNNVSEIRSASKGTQNFREYLVTHIIEKALMQWKLTVCIIKSQFRSVATF